MGMPCSTIASCFMLWVGVSDFAPRFARDLKPWIERTGARVDLLGHAEHSVNLGDTEPMKNLQQNC